MTDKKAQGRSSKRKGGRIERLAVKMLSEVSEAARIPLSGAIEGWKGDVSVYLQGKKFVAEVKGRKNPLKTIDNWIGEHDMLLIKPDYKPFYVVFTEKSFKEFVVDLTSE